MGIAPRRRGSPCAALDPAHLGADRAVMFWVAGFDILYACQDMEHDRASRLVQHSPGARGFTAHSGLRGAALAMLLLLSWLCEFSTWGVAGWMGVACVAALLLYEHLMVSPRDLRRLNAAFFTMNGVIATVFFLFIAADLLLHKH